MCVHARRLLSDRCLRRDKGPAAAATFISVYEWIIHNRLGTLHLKCEVHLLDVMAAHRLAHTVLSFRFTIEKQEPSPARPGDLASKSTVAQGKAIEFIDTWGRDLRRNSSLGLPSFMKQHAQFSYISLLKRIAHANS